VIFDTSQVHANVVFPHMFAWLDTVLEIIRIHPETLFVIRAHPDEMRLNKESHESVRQWVKDNRVEQLPNVAFIDSEEYLSSYRLIQRSKFVLVYNSSIGLEAALMGARCCAAGRRAIPIPVAFFPKSAPAFREQTETFLAAERIEVASEYLTHARRFLYSSSLRQPCPSGISWRSIACLVLSVAQLRLAAVIAGPISNHAHSARRHHPGAAFLDLG